MRCLIVDDELPAREEMRKLLAAHGEARVVGDAADVETALRLLEEQRPEVIFLDVQLRGETGFDFLAQAPPPLPHVIFVTAFDRYAVDAFRADAVDYLLKPVEPASLTEALNRVRRRVRVGDAPSLGHPATLQSLGLTAREAEVLFWIAQGKSNPEISGILNNAPGTVKKQVQRILDHLEVDNRVGAALIAARILGASKR